MGKLTPKQIDSYNEPGTYEDGDGLRLVVKAGEKKYWILRFQLAGKRREMGLGPYPDVKLKQARERAIDERRLLQQNIDPLVARAETRLRFSRHSKMSRPRQSPSSLWQSSTSQLTALAGKTPNMVSRGKTLCRPMPTRSSKT